ncbi:helix-turn-helix domain-containing protein [Streptomyces erythrochromogenes]|uniref:helix-turn-helix domain-containing protein n=1 Tax=Streptomyces erythrochromogenes TaxID=285574 RepID=UPI0036CACCB0
MDSGRPARSRRPDRVGRADSRPAPGRPDGLRDDGAPHGEVPDRAFAAAGEQVIAHIRHRPLHEARLALVSPSGRLSISELAAHWQFADGSHFTRALKKQYGQTPTEYARSAGAAPPSPNRRPPGRGASGRRRSPPLPAAPRRPRRTRPREGSDAAFFFPGLESFACAFDGGHVL